MTPTSALILAAGELDEASASLRDVELFHTADRLKRIAVLLLKEHTIMGLFANALHLVEQKLVDANAAKDKAQADADKNAADAKTLADLRAGGFIADQGDVDAANEVLNPPGDTVPAAG